jgi:hypothetical protein
VTLLGNYKNRLIRSGVSAQSFNNKLRMSQLDSKRRPGKLEKISKPALPRNGMSSNGCATLLHNTRYLLARGVRMLRLLACRTLRAWCLRAAQKTLLPSTEGSA